MPQPKQLKRDIFRLVGCKTIIYKETVGNETFGHTYMCVCVCGEGLVEQNNSVQMLLAVVGTHNS